MGPSRSTDTTGVVEALALGPYFRRNSLESGSHQSGAFISGLHHTEPRTACHPWVSIRAAVVARPSDEGAAMDLNTALHGKRLVELSPEAAVALLRPVGLQALLDRPARGPAVAVASL